MYQGTMFQVATSVARSIPASRSANHMFSALPSLLSGETKPEPPRSRVAFGPGASANSRIGAAVPASVGSKSGTRSAPLTERSLSTYWLSGETCGASRARRLRTSSAGSALERGLSVRGPSMGADARPGFGSAALGPPQSLMPMHHLGGSPLRPRTASATSRKLVAVGTSSIALPVRWQGPGGGCVDTLRRYEAFSAESMALT